MASTVDSIPGDAGSRAHLRSMAALTDLFAPAVDPDPLPDMVPFSELRPGQAVEHDHDDSLDEAADIDNGEAWPSLLVTPSLPEPGDMLTLDELPCCSYIRIAGEDFLFLGHRQGVMDLLDDSGVHASYPAGEGEPFAYLGDVIA